MAALRLAALILMYLVSTQCESETTEFNVNKADNLIINEMTEYLAKNHPVFFQVFQRFKEMTAALQTELANCAVKIAPSQRSSYEASCQGKVFEKYQKLRNLCSKLFMKCYLEELTTEIQQCDRKRYPRLSREKLFTSIAEDLPDKLDEAEEMYCKLDADLPKIGDEYRDLMREGLQFRKNAIRDVNPTLIKLRQMVKDQNMKSGTFGKAVDSLYGKISKIGTYFPIGKEFFAPYDVFFESEEERKVYVILDTLMARRIKIDLGVYFPLNVTIKDLKNNTVY